MNYPIWSLPAPGLLIAAVAILHVFISHFAVGGGLFLVLAERRARRTADEALLAYLERHSRFFILLTLVLGAITGVGIWFTIGLVHPKATSSLINTFVRSWAIEWTFFVTEIAAALVYYHGWKRLSPQTHVAVGWIYFGSAWLSLVVINGILSFMLTPGAWLETGSFWAGLANPTWWPSTLARTFAAIGLAGLYALLTAARLADQDLKARVARYAGTWIVSMAIALPLSIAWFLAAAQGAGVPAFEILGAPSGRAADAAAAILRGSPSGYPAALNAVRVVLAGSLLTLLLSLLIVYRRARGYGTVAAALVLACAFGAMGAGEWVREDLRKPYVLAGQVFVNGVRVPKPAAVPAQPDATADPFTVTSLRATGVLRAARWTRLPEPAADPVANMEAEGREVFRLLCRSCHTTDGYLAIRPLVAGKGTEALRTIIANLASPAGPGGDETSWDQPPARLRTWRGRRMPPFAGTDQERLALAFYLARLGGTPAELPGKQAATGPAQAYFDENCSACHGTGADFPIGGRGRTPAELHEMLGRLPEINEVMPPFEGPDDLRQALAEHLAKLP